MVREMDSNEFVASKRRNLAGSEGTPLLLPPLSKADSSLEIKQETSEKSLDCPTGKASLSDCVSGKVSREGTVLNGKNMGSCPIAGKEEEDNKEKLVTCSSVSSGDEKGFAADGENSGLLDLGKKRLLSELGNGKSFRGGNRVQIRVIDGTALIDLATLCKSVFDRPKNQEQSRRTPKAEEMHLGEERKKYQNDDSKNEGKCRGIYSRKEMEALRFVKVVEQRKLWCDVFSRLGAAVRREYDDLAREKHYKNVHLKFDPNAPAILGKFSASGARHHLNIFAH